MRWWWSLKGDVEIADSKRDQRESTNQAHENVPAAEEFTDQAHHVAPPKQLNRDELAYEELKSIFSSVNEESAALAASKAKGNVAAAAKRSTEASESPLYPSTMKCSQVFDQAFYCQSIGGQLNSVYRHGQLRSCSELWAQWRFCMRMKGVGDEERAVRIRRHYRERAAKLKMGANSEDVWEVRKLGDGDEETFKYHERT